MRPNGIGCYSRLRILAAWIGFLVPAALLGQSLTWLGTLGGAWSYAYDISPDGRVVVGVAQNERLSPRPFLWTAVDGMRDLGTLGGTGGEARAVSADGMVVVGIAEDGNGRWRAFRWRAGVGMADLGTLGGAWSAGLALSRDGAFTAGWADNGAGNIRAVRWASDGQLEELGTLGGLQSAAYGISADGAIVVGWAHEASGARRAFRWSATEGMQNLGTFPGGGASAAIAVSADGTVVAGAARIGPERTDPPHMFRWTAADGLQDLGTLPDFPMSHAFDVSDDGRVIVGYAQNAEEEYRAIIWTPQRGLENLNERFAALLADGSILWVARAVSADGRYIVGRGYNAASGRFEAYLLDTIPEPTSLTMLIGLLLGLAGSDTLWRKRRRLPTSRAQFHYGCACPNRAQCIMWGGRVGR